MSGAPRPTTPARQASATPVGARATSAPTVDLEEVTRRVYQLMLEDLRLDLARNTGTR